MLVNTNSGVFSAKREDGEERDMEMLVLIQRVNVALIDG